MPAKAIVVKYPKANIRAPRRHQSSHIKPMDRRWKNRRPVHIVERVVITDETTMNLTQRGLMWSGCSVGAADEAMIRFWSIEADESRGAEQEQKYRECSMGHRDGSFIN